MARSVELQIQQAVCDYVRFKYPKVRFISDLSGLKLSMGLAKKVKYLKSHRGCPDIIILKPNQNYCGLFIELKTSIEEVMTKSGTLKKDKHVEEQANFQHYLNENGYFATWGFGFDHACQIIDNYLMNPKSKKKNG